MGIGWAGMLDRWGTQVIIIAGRGWGRAPRGGAGVGGLGAVGCSDSTFFCTKPISRKPFIFTVSSPVFGVPNVPDQEWKTASGCRQ